MGKILVPSGEAVVGRLIAVLVDTADAATAFKAISADDVLKALGGGSAVTQGSIKPAASAPAPAPPASVAPTATAAVQPISARSAGSRVTSSPYARKLAAESGVDISSISAGTGPGGRIIAADVQEYKASSTGKIGASNSVLGSAGGAWDGEYVDTPQSGVRRIIAQRLTASKQQVPHYYLTSEINLDTLLATRAALNAELPPEGKLSVNDFLIRACALACKKVPEVNSSWMGDVIRTYDYVDVSVAVAVPSGLITPIVRDAHVKGLSSISRFVGSLFLSASPFCVKFNPYHFKLCTFHNRSTVKSLVEKARASKLTPEEYQGGTFTISNLGSFGVRQFAAIVNPPQAGILAVGAAEKRVVPDPNGSGGAAWKQATIMNVTLSADHRVVDGAVGAAWLNAFKDYMERPNTMML